MTDTSALAAQIEALAKKASKGDWQQVEHTEVWDARGDGEPGVPLLKGVTDTSRRWGRERDAVQVRDDISLICLLKNNLPAIVTALRQADRETRMMNVIRDLRSTLQRIANDEGDTTTGQACRAAIGRSRVPPAHPLRQAEAAPGVVEARKALLIARTWGSSHDSSCKSLIVPVCEDGPWLDCSCQMPARMKMIDDAFEALARQHGAREGMVTIAPMTEHAALAFVQQHCMFSWKDPMDLLRAMGLILPAAPATDV